MNIKVGVSARHVHLNEETYNKLFSNPLEKIKDLDQPGQFAAKQTVTIKNENGSFENVRIVGPLRDYNQIEISKTDSYKLKVNPPIRQSGDLEGSLPITIVGPKGELNLEKGLIIAGRHVHLTRENLNNYNLNGVNEVAIKINGQKSGILKSVFLKVTDQANLRLHLDTDDANAFNLNTDDEVELLKIKEGR